MKDAIQSTVSGSDKKFWLGFDIGSVSLNTVVCDKNFGIVAEYYDYIHGRPFEILFQRLKELLVHYPIDEIVGASCTGSGGVLAAQLLGAIYTNEIIAQACAIGNLFPQAKTVIEIGGEDSKLILLEPDSSNGHAALADFEMNSICAAGTGSFLDQQARRMGISIEKEFGEMALRSVNPPRLAGRCSVFAKSDMIHHQQIATPLHDIVAGLCFAMARTFRSQVARKKEIVAPVFFTGGVAANAGMVRAFREVLQLNENELVVPRYHASMGALGCLLYNYTHGLTPPAFKGLSGLESYLHSDRGHFESLPVLPDPGKTFKKDVHSAEEGKELIPVYLGVDVGSLSTNVVLIDDQHRVLARRYLPTAGKPLEAVRQGLDEIYSEIGSKVRVMAAGTTGSGRYLTGDYMGADCIRNEITAQATAAIDYDPEVDTIFEIGGQDSKYISIDHGVVVDFEMNKVCAAGTGSFLEEQAEKLNIKIVKEFGNHALHSKQPAKFGDRCTVFMESDLNSHMQRGVKNEDLVGGLAYSIVYNYLRKVVGNKRIGNRIFFQGGVTNNISVVSAFEKVLGKEIIVPPHFDVTGAIGAAILAKESMAEGVKTNFKGFDIRNVPYTLSTFTCKHCTNQCEIRKVKIDNETKALFYGGRCERYEKDERKGKNHSIPDLFKHRTELLLSGYTGRQERSRAVVGIPRALMVFYQQFPFWNTFFHTLNFSVEISGESNQQLVRKSLESVMAETCLPVELMHGHVEELVQKDVDYVFLPFIVNAAGKDDNPTVNYNCPWVQSYPFMVRAAMKGRVPEEKLLIPTFHFRYRENALKEEMISFFGKKFQISSRDILNALEKAEQAQNVFESRLKSEGEKLLQNLPTSVIPLVLIGRPYNCSDPHLNLALVEKLIAQNVLPIPLDYIPFDASAVFHDYRSMCWPNGQKILSAIRTIAKDPRLHAVCISNFRCGPDSFLSHYITEEMKGKPWLQLEIDEHSADAGMITRIEAFLDSLKGNKERIHPPEKVFRPWKNSTSPGKDKILFFPYMNDCGVALAASARNCGIQAEVLPMQTMEDLEIGRKYTSSKECFPMICTTGSFLRKLSEPGIDPSKVSFFMPDHNGPCRFGQYNHLQRIIFDRLGYSNTEIISPSNDSSYADVAGGHGVRFRFNAWRGFVAIDFLRKLLQENKPYEIVPGTVDKVYAEYLKKIEKCIGSGKGKLHDVLKDAVDAFHKVPVNKSKRKPVVSIVGEIFMRDNPFCSAFLVKRLEEMGVETVIAPFSEWIEYSSHRYARDSRWKGDRKGVLKANIQAFSQHISARILLRSLEKEIDQEKVVPLHEILKSCNAYVNKDYDGDPPFAMGTAAALANKGISGVANILPFTCMPGTLVASLSDLFRKENHGIPWINVAYDGQDTVSLETRLQAFVFQVKQFSGTIKTEAMA